MRAFLIQLIGLITGRIARGRDASLRRLIALYEPMQDEELRDHLARLLEGELIPSSARGLRMLTRRLGPQTPPAFEALAIAVCLFDRRPCDLPPGSRAYPEQVDAARLLLEGVNVQMDTGEGKTYSIALAALALLAEYPQVLVITANNYLASRDWRRVGPFFKEAGVGCAARHLDPAFRGVVYLTLQDLSFGYLRAAYQDADVESGYPLGAAVIIDEIDSVVIDTYQGYALSRHLAGADVPWKEVFGVTASWGDDDYEFDELFGRVTLRARAWQDIASLAQTTGRPTALLLDLAQGAVWATLAVEENHYRLENDRVMLINSVTGESYRSSTNGVSALEYRRFGREATVRLDMAEIDGHQLLRRHPLVVGTSGTAYEETIYFLQQFGGLTATVPARFPRHAAEIATTISASHEQTLGYLTERIQEVAPRPVIIGTWRPDLATRVHQHLLESRVVEADALALVVRFDSQLDEDAFVTAGEPGHVTVMSQGGSRGVDVRSTHNPLLIVIGRAVEPRLDRQFLGRVGRHGEVFEAEFVIDPTSPMWAPAWGGIASWSGPIPIPRPAARTLRRSQRFLWSQQLSKRVRASVLSSEESITEQRMAAELRSLLRIGGRDPRSCIGEYVGEILGTGPDRTTHSALPDAPVLEAKVVATIQHRRELDASVADFESALAATGIDLRGSVEIRTTPGPPDELVDLTRWARSAGARYRETTIDDERRLLESQLHLARRQTALTAPTNPHVRGIEDIVRETFLLANADLIKLNESQLQIIRLTSSSGLAYRRSISALRAARDDVRARMLRELLSNLTLADQPEALDDLFYSVEHQADVPSPTRSPGPEVTRGANGLPPSTRRAMTEAEIEAAVTGYLAHVESTEGALPFSNSELRLVLLGVSRSILDVVTPITAAALRRHVDLYLESIRLTGASRSIIREYDRVITGFTEHLRSSGWLSTTLPRHPPSWRALQTLRRISSTVPRTGVMAGLAQLVVFSLAFVLPAEPQRSLNVVDAATAVFGYGAWFPQHPLLGFFAVLVLVHFVRRALHVGDDFSGLALTVGPLAFVYAIAFYWGGTAHLGGTLFVLVAAAAWGSAFLALDRFVLSLLGADLATLLAAVSVILFCVQASGSALPGELLAVAVGVAAAAIGGPRLAVSVDAAQVRRGSLLHVEKLIHVRVLIDERLLAAVVAVVPATLLLGGRGPAALSIFLGLQIVVFAAICRSQLSTSQIQRRFAAMRVGSALQGEALTRHLRQQEYLLNGVAAGLAAVLFVAWRDVVGVTTATIVVFEFAGVALVAGIRAIGNLLVIAGRPDAFQANDEETLPKLMAGRYRQWRQRRYGRVIEAVGLALLLIRPLMWLANWLSLVDAANWLWDHLPWH